MNMRFEPKLLVDFCLLFILFPQSYIHSHELPIKKLEIGLNSSVQLTSSKYIDYMPIKVELEKFFFRDEIFIIKAINHRDKIIYLALDCNKFMINVVDLSLKWREWHQPRKSFEKHMLYDFCALRKRISL